MANRLISHLQNTLPRYIGILGALAILLGAFGAHALKSKLPAESLSAYQTGVLYHMIHTCALLGVWAVWMHSQQTRLLKSAMWFIIGIVLFSGSLYILSTQSLLGINASWLGPVTPIGGLSFIVGWVYVALKD